MQLPEAANLQILVDAGCDEETVRRFCELETCSCGVPLVRRRQIRLLRERRQELLGQMHACQEKLDCLDYLIYQLRKELSEGGDGI